MNLTQNELYLQNEGSGGTEGAGNVVTSGTANKATHDNLSDLISLSASQEEGGVGHLSSAVISIADASQHLSAIGIAQDVLMVICL